MDDYGWVAGLYLKYNMYSDHWRPTGQTQSLPAKVEEPYI